MRQFDDKTKQLSFDLIASRFFEHNFGQTTGKRFNGICEDESDGRAKNVKTGTHLLVLILLACFLVALTETGCAEVNNYEGMTAFSSDIARIELNS